MKRPREMENLVENVEGISSKIGDTVLPADQPVNGPTSFAGLIPSSADPQLPRPTRRIKTFQDVAGAGAQPNPTASNFIPLSRSNWLPPIMAPRPPKPTSKSTEDEAAIPASFPSMPSPPMDWSLKSTLRYTSPQPFEIWQNARSLPRSEAIDAERAFTACLGENHLSLPQRLFSAAMSWQYPQNPQPPAASRPVDTTLPAHVLRRRQDWQEGLCSLYDALRAGQCAAFYIVSPQLPTGVGKQPFSVLFGAAGVGGRSRVHAVMGRSTPGVREILRKSGVEFDAPIMGAGRKAGGVGFGAEGTRSMLVFEGALRVHALFDFLLNRVFELSDEICDVPLLLSPVQFTHAAVKKYTFSGATVTALGTNTAATAPKSRSKGNGAATPMPTSYQLEIKGGGCIPGWVSDRVLRVLSSSQGDAGVTMTCDPLPASVALNWHTESSHKEGCTTKGVFRWGGSGCLSEDEGERWCQVLYGLDTAAVKEVAFMQGTFKVVQTTPRLLPNV